jgi:hypothetical protein
LHGWCEHVIACNGACYTSGHFCCWQLARDRSRDGCGTIYRDRQFCPSLDFTGGTRLLDAVPGQFHAQSGERECVCVCVSVTHGSGSTAPLRASTQPCGPMDEQHCPVLGSSVASVYLEPWVFVNTKVSVNIAYTGEEGSTQRGAQR